MSVISLRVTLFFSGPFLLFQMLTVQTKAVATSKHAELVAFFLPLMSAYPLGKMKGFFSLIFDS